MATPRLNFCKQEAILEYVDEMGLMFHIKAREGAAGCYNVTMGPVHSECKENVVRKSVRR